MATDDLDAMRRALAPHIAAAAAFDGWSKAAVQSAAADAGVDPDAALYAFAGGAVQMIESFVEWVNDEMVAVLPRERLAALKIRERIRQQVLARLEIMAPYKEALRRAQAILAMPQNLGKATQLGWHSADLIWRQAGDTATDYNHYTKRMTLGSIYAATLTIWIADASADHAETTAFLDRRIDGIMRFEKAKARLLDKDRAYFSPVRFLGRLRYPTR